MVSHCAVWNCASKLGTANVRFYRIPEIFTKSEKLEKLSTHRRQAWIKAIKRQDLTEQELKVAKVCSLHFRKGRTVSLTEVNDPDWIPNMNLGEKKSSRLIFKQERIEDGGSSADEQVISEMHYEDDDIDESGDKNLITEDIVEEDEEHEEIVLESTPAHASQPVVVRTMAPVRSHQVLPTTTIKKITVTPVSSSLGGRKEYKVTAPSNKVSPIMVTQKFVQTSGGRTVTVMPKQDSTFKFAQIAGQTTIKRKLDTATSSPVVVKLPVDLKRFKPVQTRSLGNFVIQKDSGGIATMPKIVRLVRNKVDRTTQTDISGEFLEQYQALIDENQIKIAQLEEQVRKCKYTPEMFENDDKRTEYFTGLDSCVTMITLYNTCEAELPQSTALTKFEIFILTLLKLRLKVPLTFLAYQFCISPKAANFYFNECLNVLHKSLRELFAEPGDGQDGNIEIITEENYKE